MSFLKYIWEHPALILLAYLLLMNVALFLTMGVDKFRAKSEGRRVPEARLFLLALLGGSIGGIAGMYCFRHKTKHRSFVVGFPAILAAELSLVLFLLLN